MVPVKKRDGKGGEFGDESNVWIGNEPRTWY